MSDSESNSSGFSRGRRWLTTVNLLLSSVAMLAIVVMANYAAEGHFKRYQLADYSSFKLSPQTLRVLNSLTNDVKITIFYPRSEDDVYLMIYGLLAEYQNANPEHIHLATLDYETSPGEAVTLLTRLHLTGASQRDFVAFESNGHSKICYGRDLSEYDFDEVLSGRSHNVRRKGFLGEERFTADIFSVSYPRDMKAYFLQGHGERYPGDPDHQEKGDSPGGDPKKLDSKLAAILKDEIGCDWQTLVLTGTNPIPADCKLLIIASQRDQVAVLSSNELTQIQDYLKHDNGRLLALLDNSEGLDPILADKDIAGVELGRLPVVDLDKNVQIGDSGYVFLASLAMDPTQQIHPIVQPLAREGLRIQMVLPRPIFSSSATKTPGAPTITPLASTTTNGIEVTRTTNGLETVREYPRAIPLIAAIEKGTVTGSEGMRIVVAGDADFLDDQEIDTAANHYFASVALNWLLQRPEIAVAGLVPHPIKEYKLVFTESQTTQLRWLFLAVMPGSVLFLGSLVWLRRRA